MTFYEVNVLHKRLPTNSLFYMYMYILGSRMGHHATGGFVNYVSKLECKHDFSQPLNIMQWWDCELWSVNWLHCNTSRYMYTKISTSLVHLFIVQGQLQALLKSNWRAENSSGLTHKTLNWLWWQENACKMLFETMQFLRLTFSLLEGCTRILLHFWILWKNCRIWLVHVHVG